MRRIKFYSIFNYAFYILFFIGFFFPTNNSYYIPLGGALIKLNELSLVLLPIINEFCHSKQAFKIRDKQLRLRAILLVLIIVFTDLVVKNLVYNQPIGDGVKSIRLALPMLVGVWILFRGLNVNIKTLYNVLIYTLFISFVLSLIAFFYPHPIFYYGIDASSGDMEDFQRGRLSNSNFGFGLIGAYFLFRDKGKWYNNRNIHTATYILSVLIIVMSFNRTYLALLLLEFFLLTVGKISVSKIFRVTLLGITVVLAVFALYNTNSLVKRQLDKRILDIVFEDRSLKENVIENNRDVIYDGIRKRLKEGYWIIGLDFKTEIFNHSRHGVLTGATKTDISFINILLRFGIFALLMYVGLLYLIIRKGYMNRIILVAIVLASLNIDSLMNHNIAFFVFLMIPVLNLDNRKNIFASNK